MVKRLLERFGAALLLLASGGCATAAEGAVRPEGAVPGPALWEVKDADTTIYLFGTVHVLPEGVNWYDARIARALDASDEFVTELDMTDPAAVARAISAEAPLPAGGNLRELMAPENRAQFEQALTSLDLPPGALDAYEPWYAAMVLSLAPLQNAGFNPASGVEAALAARASGKTHAALETIADQVNMFDRMDMPYQLTYLDQAAEGVDEMLPTITTMIQQWREGEVEALGETLNDDLDDGYLTNRLLINRNMNWAGWVERRMAQPGTVFIAVGAGHLAGPGSVQDQLATRGLTVTRIWQ